MWSNDIAYIVGLITTDGNLSSDGRHIDFTSKDIELINTFKQCMSLNNKIGYKQCGYRKIKCPRIQFGNIKFYNWLISIGLSTKKSKTLESLRIPKKYMSDFLRGHIDGDGSVRAYQDKVYKNSERLYTIFNSASLKHLNWIHESISSLYALNGKLRSGTRIWQLVYAKKESILLLNKLYYNKDVPCLKRKRDQVKKYLYN
ncbi:hypothetical protein ACFL0T_04205 [Candidatus Omnitrophota bacterium]